MIQCWSHGSTNSTLLECAGSARSREADPTPRYHAGESPLDWPAPGRDPRPSARGWIWSAHTPVALMTRGTGSSTLRPGLRVEHAVAPVTRPSSRQVRDDHPGPPTTSPRSATAVRASIRTGHRRPGRRSSRPHRRGRRGAAEGISRSAANAGSDGGAGVRREPALARSSRRTARPRRRRRPVPNPMRQRNRNHNGRTRCGRDPGSSRLRSRKRLPDEAEVSLFQIAQTTVKRACSNDSTSARLVPLLDQRRAQTAGDRVQRGPAADDSAADDQHIHLAEARSRKGSTERCRGLKQCSSDPSASSEHQLAAQPTRAPWPPLTPPFAGVATRPCAAP